MEGVELGRAGSVTMIQLSATPNHVFCFDVLRLGPEIVERIRPLLEDASIMKLCYDARLLQLSQKLLSGSPLGTSTAG